MMRQRKLSIFITLLFCFAVFSIQGHAFSLSDVSAPDSAETIVYGKSGAGRDLTAYRLGTGENVMVVGFAIHGFEDNFSRDGLALVYTADLLLELLDENITTVNSYGWSIYVLPCMNPDGLLDGYSHNGPGRCTTSYINASGTLVKGTGIDMNRSFPTLWTQYSGSRNFNGYAPLASNESKALASFIQQVRGSGVNICIDAHGWLSQIITSNGTGSQLYQIFKAAFPSGSYANCNNGRGYFTAYAASLGYAACLFEFPYNVYSLSQFQKSGYPEKFNDCILKLSTTYGTYREPVVPDTPPDTTPEPEPEQPDHDCPSASFTDIPLKAWYHTAADYTLAEGIFKGMSTTTFEPDTTLTRAMLTTILYRISGDTVADLVDPPQAFPDVPAGSYYADSVLWATAHNIVQGFPEGDFRPDDPVTREQMVTMFYRFAQYQNRDVSKVGDLAGFPDVDSLQTYAVEPFAWAVGTGLIQGTTSQSGLILEPRGYSTRAQAAAVIMRYCQSLGDDAPAEDTESGGENTPEPEELQNLSLLSPAISMEDNLPADGEDLGGN